MGTINYFTSDYITLGIKPYSSYDLENDPCFMEEIQDQINEYGGTVENAINDYIQECYEADYSNIEHELNKHSFYYFHIAIKPGYYEGFTLDIENNFSLCFDDYEEKQEAQKEITEIKKFLIDCAGMGLVQCFPGWCTGYNDYTGTKKAINEAIKEMRSEVKSSPTWAQYRKAV